MTDKNKDFTAEKIFNKIKKGDFSSIKFFIEGMMISERKILKEKIEEDPNKEKIKKNIKIADTSIYNLIYNNTLEDIFYPVFSNQEINIKNKKTDKGEKNMTKENIEHNSNIDKDTTNQFEVLQMERSKEIEETLKEKYKILFNVFNPLIMSGFPENLIRDAFMTEVSRWRDFYKK